MKEKNIGNRLQIDPTSLKQKIDNGEDIFILDVRTPEEYKSWKMSYDRYKDLTLIPIDQLSSSDALEQIPKDKEIVTICALGNRSMMAANLLTQLGYNAKSLTGGMSAWNKVFDIVIIPVKTRIPVKIWQIRRISKGCMGYIVASEIDKNAVVIDPNCHINEAFIKVVKENDLHINAVIDTHMHADHVSAVTSLARKLGTVVRISSMEGYDITNNRNDGLTFDKIKDEDKIKVGDGFVLNAIHTPGHTNGSMCFSLDGTKDDDSKYVFTGDTIFIDEIGRPDLHGKAEEFTQNLYETYQQKILKLPNKIVILPAHFRGRFEQQKPIFNTLESIKTEIKALSLNKVEFVELVSRSIPPQPINHRRILKINKSMIPCNEIQIEDLEDGPNSCGIRP